MAAAAAAAQAKGVSVSLSLAAAAAAAVIGAKEGLSDHSAAAATAAVEADGSLLLGLGRGEGSKSGVLQQGQPPISAAAAAAVTGGPNRADELLLGERRRKGGRLGRQGPPGSGGPPGLKEQLQQLMADGDIDAETKEAMRVAILDLPRRRSNTNAEQQQQQEQRTTAADGFAVGRKPGRGTTGGAAARAVGVDVGSSSYAEGEVGGAAGQQLTAAERSLQRRYKPPQTLKPGQCCRGLPLAAVRAEAAKGKVPGYAAALVRKFGPAKCGLSGEQRKLQQDRWVFRSRWASWSCSRKCVG